jgi:hypothetical protein
MLLNMNYKKYYFLRVAEYITMLVLILQGGIALGQSIESNSCSNLLPEDARALINEKYNNWRILSKNDLLYDDQMLWNKNHEKECPGIAIGKYRNDNESDYAVLIIPRKDKTKKAKLLMLTRNMGGRFAIKQLYEDKNITNYPVIYKADSGQYFYFYDSKKSIVAKHDVVIYEHIEASANAFYYESDKYQQLLISD